MRKKMILIFLFAAGCLFISSNAFSAWTEAKGHSYNQLTLSYYKTTSKLTTLEKDADDDVTSTNNDEVLDPTDEKDEEEFNQTQLSYYGQYGIKDDLMAVLSGGWSHIRSNDILAHTGEEDSVSGVGDIVVGLVQKISNNVGGGPMSVELDVKIPEAYANDYENPLEFQNLGDGQYDYTLKLKFGHGFSKGYAVLDLGYKYRDYNKLLEDDIYFKPSDQFFVALSGGYSAASWLSIRGKLDWTKAVGNARVSGELIDYAACCGINEDEDPAEAILILDTLGLEQSSLTAGLSLAFSVNPKLQVVASYDWTLDGMGLFRNLDWGVLESENASIGETFSLALAYSY